VCYKSRQQHGTKTCVPKRIVTSNLQSQNHDNFIKSSAECSLLKLDFDFYRKIIEDRQSSNTTDIVK